MSTKSSAKVVLAGPLEQWILLVTPLISHWWLTPHISHRSHLSVLLLQPLLRPWQTKLYWVHLAHVFNLFLFNPEGLKKLLLS